MTLYPAATYRPVPNHGGLMTQHLGLILHVQAGDGSPFGWFCDPSSQASSTWWVGKDGTVEQYVDADERAWAQMAGNASYNSVETEGQPSEPLTDAQVAALTDLYAWGHQTFGWPLAVAETPGEPGFGWHGMGGQAWGSHFGCPGDLRKAQRATILARVIGTPKGDDVQVPTLKRGDEGTQVKALQCVLNGYLAFNRIPRASLVVDGRFGANVQGAVQDLQKKWGDTTDFGQVTPHVWWVLLGKPGPDPKGTQ